MVQYLGNGGGYCWEPSEELGFTPNLNSISFNYKRSSGRYPDPIVIRVQNPSYSKSYEVDIKIDEMLFTTTPSFLLIPPRETKVFSVALNRNRIEQFIDGQTNVPFDVNVTEV
jgi:hypothetical protein